eukprot:scaffold60788_cov15-Tisochrysis_lutea.AAC.1
MHGWGRYSARALLDSFAVVMCKGSLRCRCGREASTLGCLCHTRQSLGRVRWRQPAEEAALAQLQPGCPYTSRPRLNSSSLWQQRQPTEKAALTEHYHTSIPGMPKQTNKQPRLPFLLPQCCLFCARVRTP